MLECPDAGCCPNYERKDPMEGRSHPLQSQSWVSGEVRHQVVHPRAQPMLQTSENRPHRSSVYSKSCEVSALRGESPVQTMPGSERQAGGSKGQMGKLPGGAPSLQPALPKKERDSTSSYQTNPCPAPTRTSQTENPCQKRLSTRAQNQSNSSSSSNNPQTRLYDSRKSPSSSKAPSKTTSAKECKSNPVTNKEKKIEKQRLVALQKEKEREKKESQKKSQKEAAMLELEDIVPKKPTKPTPPKQGQQTHPKVPIEVTPPHNPKANHNLKTHISLLKNQIQIVKKMCQSASDNPQQISLLVELQESIMTGLDLLMEQI